MVSSASLVMHVSIELSRQASQSVVVIQLNVIAA